MAQHGVTKMRIERIADDRERTMEKLTDLQAIAEEEKRQLNDSEQEQAMKYRSQITEYDEEITLLASDIEAQENSRDVSEILRPDTEKQQDVKKRISVAPAGVPVYRNYAEYARDELVTRYPQIAEQAAGAHGNARELREQAAERLHRAVEHTLSTDVAGLLPPQHIAQIMDIIDAKRPVVSSARKLDLERGSLTYPKIEGRPEVLLQSSEKTEGGTADMNVDLDTLTASTYIGGGNLSWQAINWSSPDALQLWFDLAAEAYARQTEEVACDTLEDNASVGTLGTASGRLGTAGTESFAQWRAAILGGLASIYSTTAGRQNSNTLYLSAARFFQLAGLGSDQTLQMSAVGNLDIGSMTGTYAGLRVVGSYAFDQDVAIVGDGDALLVGETAGAPVQMRVIEPTIGGMEVGVIGAFAATVFDAQRFLHLSTHL
jgi:HK97 family phage major capsid protein